MKHKHSNFLTQQLPWLLYPICSFVILDNPWSWPPAQTVIQNPNKHKADFLTHWPLILLISSSRLKWSRYVPLAGTLSGVHINGWGEDKRTMAAELPLSGLRSPEAEAPTTSEGWWCHIFLSFIWSISMSVQRNEVVQIILNPLQSCFLRTLFVLAFISSAWSC